MSFNHVALYICGYVTFFVATMTDYFDGKIARERNLVTNFGKLLDPVADKVLMAAAFVMLMPVPELWVPGWVIVMILAREFLVTGARSLAAAEGRVIAANRWGKRKTVYQMVYIYTFLFLVIAGRIADVWWPEQVDVFNRYLAPVSLGTIVFVGCYTVYTGIQFARVNWQALNLKED
jgi:CDP-diacylglycerol--glycerol-3-phosphate 3-phosphatidyltransferase